MASTHSILIFARLNHASRCRVFRSRVVGVSTEDLKQFSEPFLYIDGTQDGWIGMCSPSLYKKYVTEEETVGGGGRLYCCANSDAGSVSQKVHFNRFPSSARLRLAVPQVFLADIPNTHISVAPGNQGPQQLCAHLQLVG